MAICGHLYFSVYLLFIAKPVGCTVGSILKFGNRDLVILKFGIWITLILSKVSLKNWHKSNLDQVILDSKTWDFQIRINLIQIKFFEQLGPG